MKKPHILVIDNYDSFTFNLVASLQKLLRCTVLPNDAPLPADLQTRFDGALVSPGPCSPSEAGSSLTLYQRLLARELLLPTLGVCLGHQALAQVAGGRVVHAKRPMHGKTVRVSHDGSGLFAGLPSPLQVARYNSLTVEQASLPKELTATARSLDDDEIMALTHTTLPLYSVQFHPESHLCEAAEQVLLNFAHDLHTGVQQ
jgi:anthranilate synthase/aminodeoxychorismate synthase-like glutamine amidotransferase